MSSHPFNGPYTGSFLDRVAFPLGGIGAGMVALEGVGSLSQVSIRHRPEVGHEPMMFAALHVAGAKTARVLEGVAPMWKAFGVPQGGSGRGHTTLGLPRFAQAQFTARMPFATVTLSDPAMPVSARLTGWSPLIPGDADASSLPLALLEYELVNATDRAARCVFSYHAANFLAHEKHHAGARIRRVRDGFVLEQDALADKPWVRGSFAIMALQEAQVDCAWFRGGWFDPLTMVWNRIQAGDVVEQPPHEGDAPGRGGSLYIPVTLAAGGSHTVRLVLAWHVPLSQVRQGLDPQPEDVDAAKASASACCDSACACVASADHYYRPWYARAFRDVDHVLEHAGEHYDDLRARSATFADAFYDTTLPPEVVEAAAANLGILKSPTVMRQFDGRLWAWEGCHDDSGCCPGSCTHVWNYAQAIAHLFPALERTLRESEFCISQDERGHQNFRTNLPIRPPVHNFHAAADGQLGGVMKVYREWRISGDDAWLARLWPAVRRSLDYCISTWDPDHTGRLVEPHHNTYDIEFWGPDGMCTSFYAGALASAVAMGQACGDDVTQYETLLQRAKQALAQELFNGEYFIQKVQWRGLRAGDPTQHMGLSASMTYSAEARAILEREGPKYQYGDGCLSDGVIGDWMARCCGLGAVLDPAQTASHVAAVFRHNFRSSLADHANPQRPGYAMGHEAGLLLCSWPGGGKPSLPFVYSDEVWTGIEYQVAAHLIMLGHVEEGLTIVRAVRTRYDGRYRNPFDEYECGHWYARAMSSYSLLQALSGARYDAVTKVLDLRPGVRGDFRAFLATADGFGTVGVRDGRPFFDVVHGRVEVQRIDYTPCER